MPGTGSGLLDFGAFPGKSDATLVITGEAGILAGSRVEAWIEPADTADHTADEHVVETLKVVARSKVAGVGFTIQGVNTSQLNEPLLPLPGRSNAFASAQAEPQAVQRPTYGGMGTRIWGLWTVAWAWY